MEWIPQLPLAETDVMHYVWIAVVGGVIGWLASLVMKTDAQMGLVMNILVGIAGAALGYFLAGTLGISYSGTLGAILVQLGGAVVLILILKALKVLR